MRRLNKGAPDDISGTGNTAQRLSDLWPAGGANAADLSAADDQSCGGRAAVHWGCDDNFQSAAESVVVREHEQLDDVFDNWLH